jgi:hypothetical protein
LRAGSDAVDLASIAPLTDKNLRAAARAQEHPQDASSGQEPPALLAPPTTHTPADRAIVTSLLRHLCARIQAAIDTRRRAAVGHLLPTMKWWPKGGGENVDCTILPAKAPRGFAGPNLLAMIRSESSAGISH